MSDDFAAWLRSQVDDDETLAESDYDIMISARKVRDVSAEITYLRAVLAAARREGMEEAAKITLKLRDEWRNPEQRGGVAYAEAIAAAIARAAAKEEK